MNPQDAIDFSREAIKTCLMVGGPILVACLLIGILVGVLQAMTQVQDQTVSFVPKILMLILTIGLCLPWLTDQMMDFAQYAFEKPMTQWSTTSRPRLFPERDRPTLTAQAEALPVPDQPAIFKTSNAQDAGSGQIDNNPTLEAWNSPGKTPFILPHYRMSQAPKSDIGG